MRKTGVVLGASLAALLTATALGGCSGLNAGTLPGGSPVGSAQAGPSTGSHTTPPVAAKSTKCVSNGTSIPDGHYVGKMDLTIDVTMTLTVDGVSIPNAGGGKEHWTGSVNVTAKSGKVTGSLTMSELGLSQVGTQGGVQVHSVDNGDLKGTISGSASAPAVSASGTGDWSSLDAPAGNTSGSATSTLNGGLHITKADCSSITGDAAAMFTDFMKPVSQYLSVTNTAAWTATRQ